ncbi:MULTISPECIES: zinc-dependent alcohol dehydrogenase family protein [Bradyrhizobium]|uniref:zinc-dependent alcohol dehydrogenase family protein n=1 Tax=Bradyrhizobium TaxID=374 RepID=UPI000489C152|nr:MULTISPECIES: NAD(P)-dependent alcohol dehydrogenase [Bradyrhizobium]UFW46475.1 NAD(P)-dependent alcohol dehydrogenase [Bradyrhizobium arachidis]
MKGYAYVDAIRIDALTETDWPDPRPRDHDIVVAMKAVALNYRDLAIADGSYHIAVKPPLVPVSDGAGEVVAIGRSVRRFRVGDRVCAVYLPDWKHGALRREFAARRLGGPSDGVMRELMCASEEDFVLAPQHLSFEEAATMPVSAVTAWQSMFVNGAIQPGDNVLVQGTGGVSIAAIQLARAAGARPISVVRTDRHHRDLLRIGATDVVVSQNQELWPGEVLRLTGGEGANVIVNVAGGETVAHCLLAAAVGATVHLVGYASEKMISFDMFEAIRRAAKFFVATAGSRESFERLTRLFELEQIHPIVGGCYSVRDHREAMASLRRGGHLGKVVLTFD